MEWIRISNNKLKIMLSAEDVRRYALTPPQEADALPDRSAFRAILTDVRGICGFDATEDKVYIQMYPSKEGGCELFLTKMGLLTPKDATPALPVLHKAGQAVFLIDTTDGLLCVCRALKARHYQGKSAVWLYETGQYLLLLAEGDERRAFDFVAEFGRRCPAADFLPFLPEHGRPVCRENAVETLSAI